MKHYSNRMIVLILVVIIIMIVAVIFFHFHSEGTPPSNQVKYRERFCPNGSRGKCYTFE